MKWIELIYSETDFGKSVSTAISGIIGLILYLLFSDWVLAAIAMIISFPIIRIIANYFHEKVEKKAKQEEERDIADKLYNDLSDNEKEVIKGFIEVDSCVIPWRVFNAMSLPTAGSESLIQRGFIDTSMTADGLRETFVLDTRIFDAARRQEKSP
jgi:uncharacterized membrane protein